MKHSKINMLEGPLSKNILFYALPVVLSGVLQLIYNAADMFFVARWVGGTALAAVGANSSLISLITNFFIGLSVGANILVGRLYGAKDKDALENVVHTAMAASVIFGIIAMAVSFIFARNALVMMSTPTEVLDLATIYLKIYIIGMPVTAVYNFGAAILCAVGDSKKPLYILTTSATIKIVLNIIFVIVFKLSVVGAAVATVISMTVSAIMAICYLVRTKDIYKFQIKKTKIHLKSLTEILFLGFPASIQNCTMAFSNVVIQSTVNSFGPAVISGIAAATTLENLVYVSMNGFYHTSIAFTAQNYGAKNVKRMRSAYKRCALFVALTGAIVGGLTIVFGSELLSLFTATSSADAAVLPSEIIKYGLVKIKMLGTCFALCGLMDVTVGAIRGMGNSWTPMIVGILGLCGIRVLWVLTVFKWLGSSLEALFLSYPVTWLITFLAHFICLIIYRKKIEKSL